MLLEKCTRQEREQRPRNAIELRNEDVLVDILKRIENGEPLSELLQIVKNDEIIADLQKRLKIAEQASERMQETVRQKDQAILEKDQVKRLIVSEK